MPAQRYVAAFFSLFHYSSLRLFGVFACGILDLFVSLSHWFVSPQRGTADAEINVDSAESSKFPQVLPLMPGIGRNVAVHVSPTAKNFFLSDVYLLV